MDSRTRYEVHRIGSRGRRVQTFRDKATAIKAYNTIVAGRSYDARLVEVSRKTIADHFCGHYERRVDDPRWGTEGTCKSCGFLVDGEHQPWCRVGKR